MWIVSLVSNLWSRLIDPCSDPLPWQCLERYPESCKNLTFVDVDYPLLMAKKCSTVLATPELMNMLKNPTLANKDGIMFQSDQYVQVGCDLREISTLSKILQSILNTKDSLVLFTAEVSITYMRPPYADSLIEWAGTTFCDGTNPLKSNFLANDRIQLTLIQLASACSSKSYQTGRNIPLQKQC